MSEELTYNGQKLPEIKVTAPRKYITRYDENGNPVYTTDRNLSISSHGEAVTNAERDKRERIAEIKNRPKGQLTGTAKVASDVAVGTIGSAMLTPHVIAKIGADMWMNKSATLGGFIGGYVGQILDSNLEFTNKINTYTEPYLGKLPDGSIGNTIGGFGGSIISYPLYTSFKNGLWFLKHPGYTKVYHVNNQGKKFDLRQARTASENNIGIHVTPNKEMAQSFNRNAPVMEAYIPKHNMETIDIGANDYRLMSNNYVIDARPEYLGNYYDAAGNPELQFNLINKYGGEPIIKGNQLFTKNRVTIPLQKETWSDMPTNARKIADRIIKEGEHFDFSLTPEQNRSKARKLNQQISDLLSQYGKKVIKYNNNNPMEGNGGTAYIITDPSIFFIPEPLKIKYKPYHLINYINEKQNTRQ